MKKWWWVPFSVVSMCFLGYLSWMAYPLIFETGSAKTVGEVIATRGQLGDSFGVLNSLFSGLGFAAIVVTLWVQRNQSEIQQKQIEIQQEQLKAQEQERIEEVTERRSLFNLNGALEAIERARELLSDNNNDRRTWLEAGRLLGHAKMLGDGVLIDCHQRVLEANKLRYRKFFSELLGQKNASFFYGVNDAYPIREAAIASNSPEVINGIRMKSGSRSLAEESIYRVWEAAQWPVDFDDPIGPKFSEEERQKLIFNARGLREYLEHREAFRVEAGDLRPRSRPAADA